MSKHGLSCNWPHDVLFYFHTVNHACKVVMRDSQQCVILTSVDSDEPVQPCSPLLSLETPNGVRSVA